MLFAFGSNGSGQLGITGTEDVSSPTRCVYHQSHIPKLPLRVAAGGNHTLVLMSAGDMYATGSNDHGRIGLPKSLVAVESFNYVPPPEKDCKFRFCSATWEASILITTDNIIYTCGVGNKGELGQGVGSTTSPLPQQLSGFPPVATEVVDLSSCVGHTVAVLSNGEAYAWGNGRKGQLGEPSAVVWSPRKIAGLHFKVIRAVCGREFTHLLGDPKYGQHAVLGADKWNVVSSAPSSILGWKDIVASWGSLYVLNTTGTLLSWGRNDHGQLAPGALPLIAKIAAGSEHCLALTWSGELLAWGWGEHGNCGPIFNEYGDVTEHWNSVTLQDAMSPSAIVGIGAGCATSWLWKQD
ncbi:MAG: hypothetical protein FRX48_03525 [Lasallia pustulata]|uniref:RCC1-like domain-containing protein n=1 Tax=Lasallia pustulata TaxID=136370 RepID=A0A5M8PSX4_9LECA|nr:MAG: hypothetical protein FRX48_03525 [Lasallia pustulata]